MQYDLWKPGTFCGKLKLEIEDDKIIINPSIESWREYFLGILPRIV